VTVPLNRAADAFDGYAAAFRTSRVRAHALVGGMTGAQANWKPAPDAWSVAECLAHLNVTAEAYGQALTRALADAPPRPVNPASLRYGLVGTLFVRAVRPGSRPLPTLPAMRPPAGAGGRSGLDPADVLAAFDRHTDALVAVTELARGTDAGRVRVRSPFLPLIRFPLAALLDGLGQHALRHVGQAERVVAHGAFPRDAFPQ
jgi:hypothetical protein